VIRDPFARINQRFAQFGIRPIRVAGPLDPVSQSAANQATGEPSPGDFQSHLSHEERQSLLASIAKVPLSALGAVGGFLDKALGGRALRSLLGGGSWRELLSIIPGSDVLGITSREDIVGGRDVLEHLKILGKNQPGFDWGDVAGFGAEILLDPATYLTLGGSAVLSGAGKGLSKIGKLAAVERAVATKAGAAALNLLTPLSKRLARRKLTLRQLENAQEAIEPVMRGGKEVLEFKPAVNKLKELRTYDAVTGNAIPLSQAIKNTGVNVTDDLLDMALGSPIGKGLPFRWKPHMGEKFLGVKTETIARNMDWIGDKARWSYPGRLGSKIFSPELRGMPMNEEVQKAALRKSSINEAVAGELDAMYTRVVNKWKDHGDFDVAKILKKKLDDARAAGDEITDELTKKLEREAQDIAVENSQAVRRYIEGYELGENGLPAIPAYDPGNVGEILMKLDVAVKKLDDDLAELLNKSRPKDTLDPRYGLPDNQIIAQSDELKRLAGESAGIRELAEKLKGNPNSQGLIDLGLKEAGMMRGVHHRVKPRLPAGLERLGDDIDYMVGEMEASAKFAMDMGLDIPDLGDWLAKYMPRDAYFIPEKGVAGAWRSARRRRTGGATFADDMGSEYGRRRKDPLREVYGGTDTLMRLTTKLGPDGTPLYVGKLDDLTSVADKSKAIDEVAELLAKNEFAEFQKLDPEFVGQFVDEAGVIDPKKLRGLAGWLAGIDAKHAEIGMPAFDINPIKALRDYAITIRQSGHAADLATDLLAETAIPVAGRATRVAEEAAEQSTMHGRSILQGWSLNTDTARKHLYAKLEAIKTSEEFAEFKKVWGDAGLLDEFGEVRNLEEAFQHISMPKQIEADVTRYMQSFTRPETLHEFIAAWDAVTNIFRTSLTIPWPAFHTRNLLAGQMNNFYGGASDPTAWGPMKWIKPISQAKKIIDGQVIEGIANDIPQFAGKLTDKQVTRMIVEQLSARGVVGARQTREDLVRMFEDGSWASWANDMARGIPGVEPMSLTRMARGAGRAVGEALADPLAAAGRVLNPKKLTQDLVRGGRAASEYVEGLNRIAPFLAFLKQGMSFEEAARRVKLLQVDYRALSETEKRVFKRLILFYSFTRRQIPFILGNLAGEPGGAMAQMVKGLERVRKASNEGELVPEWMAHTPGVRIDKVFPGSAANGMARYITSLGGLLGGAEDVLGVMRPGRGILETAQRTGSGIMGRVNPMIQRPLELATGYSFFTGRPLKELKSPTGRLLGQLAGRDEPFESFAGIPLSPAAETVIQTIPGLGRGVSTLRGFTDWPRRPFVDEGGQFSMANLAARFLPGTTGIRITDIDLASKQNRLLQDMLEKQLKDIPEARMFEHLYIRKEDLEKLTPEQRMAYDMYRKMASEMQKRARERKKREKLAAAFST